MAVIRNGYLWTCQHAGLDNANGTYTNSGSTVNRSGIQWWKFQLNSTGTPPTYSASGMVYDSATSNPWWYYMPSLAVNSNNVILVGFSGSNPNNMARKVVAVIGVRWLGMAFFVREPGVVFMPLYGFFPGEISFWGGNAHPARFYT